MSDQHYQAPPFAKLQGYYSRFYQLVGASGFNHREAYYFLESELEECGLPGRYSSPESFRAAKSQYRKRGGVFRLLEG